MANYSASSPWYRTPFTNDGNLDVLKIRAVPADSDDTLYVLEPQYTHRPDLLSYDLYGTPKLWWVFANRNMDVIKDPIYDFRAGVSIFLPKAEPLKKSLGI